jgi:Uma2 family endonuclease
MTPINHISKGEKDMAVAVETEVKPENKITLDPEREYEIVNGQPEEKEMAGAKHGGVGHRLGRRLGLFVEDHQLGEVYGPDTTFLIGENQRLPDIAFVSAARMPAEGEPDGIWEIAPDLAVEVISPNDVYDKVEDKVWEYFAAGVKQVWLVSLGKRTITVYRSPVDPVVFTEDQELVSEDLLPGFRCRLSEIFRSLAHSQA